MKKTWRPFAISARRRKCQRSSLRIIGAMLAFGLISLQTDVAIAYQGGSALPRVGSLNDYIEQSRDRASAPQGLYMSSEGQGSAGSRTGSHSQMNRAVIGAMILMQWTLQRFQERQRRHHRRYAIRNYRVSGNSRGFNTGYPMSSPLGHGFWAPQS
jgi:hypothetical protein